MKKSNKYTAFLFICYLTVRLNCFKHGNNYNEISGGTCAEFKQLNNLTSICCPEGRDDECYMKHFDTRCYCDTFCDRLSDNSDCCPDAAKVCAFNVQLQEQTTCTEGEFFMDNCNKCIKNCATGHYMCTTNVCLINTQLLNSINSKAYSWKASNYSQFWGKTLEEGYLNRLGTNLETAPPKKYSKPFNYEHESMGSYDFREFMIKQKNLSRNFMVRNMGDCGSSWAFSTLDVIGDRAALNRPKKISSQIPSVQHLLSCSGDSNIAKKSCQTNTVRQAWSFLEAKTLENNTNVFGGVTEEACYPYSSQNGTVGKCFIKSINRVKCQTKKSNPHASLFRVSSSYAVDTRKIVNIMKEIKDRGPVQMVFKVYSDFFMYKSGIYSRTLDASLPQNSNVSFYHSVKVIGWNKSDDNIPYWIAANYWGKSWGEQGYFRIRIDDQDTQIGKHVYAGMATFHENRKFH